MKEKKDIKTYHIASEWFVSIDESHEVNEHNGCLDTVVETAVKMAEEDGHIRYVVEIVKIIKTDKAPYKVTVEDKI